MKKYDFENLGDAEYQADLRSVMLGNLVDEICQKSPSEFNDAVISVGASLLSHIITLCKAVLRIACERYVSEDGTVEMPTFADLAKRNPNVPSFIPKSACVWAAGLTDIKKRVDKGEWEVDPSLLRAMLSYLREFIHDMWIMSGMNDQIKRIYDVCRNMYDRYDHAYKKYWDEYCEMTQNHELELPSDYRFSMLYPSDKVDMDKLSDEELDRFYRIRNKNSDKHIAIVEILEIFRDMNTDRDHRLGVNDVQGELEKKCGIRMERRAVSRDLVQLQEADYLCAVQGENGYWYDEEVAKHRYSDYE